MQALFSFAPVCLSLVAAPPEAAQQLLVLPTTFGDGVDAQVAELLEERVVVALGRTEEIRPTSFADLDALARTQKTHDLIGCQTHRCLIDLASSGPLLSGADAAAPCA